MCGKTIFNIANGKTVAIINNEGINNAVIFKSRSVGFTSSILNKIDSSYKIFCDSICYKLYEDILNNKEENA